MGTPADPKFTDTATDPNAAERGDRQLHRHQQGNNNGNHEQSGTAEAAIGKVSAEDRWEIRFKLSVSQRYCKSLENHYAFLDQLTVFINLLGGSAVMVDVLKNFENVDLSLWGSLTILIISLMATIFRWSDKARHFSSQKRGYIHLLERLERKGRSLTEEQLNALNADFMLLEAEEGKTKNTLASLCHNEECQFRNISESTVKLYFWQRWLATYLP